MQLCYATLSRYQHVARTLIRKKELFWSKNRSLYQEKTVFPVSNKPKIWSYFNPHNNATGVLNPTTIFHEKKNKKNSNLIYKATLLVKTETSRHTEKYFFSRLYEELNLRRPSRTKSGCAAFLTFPKLRSWLFLSIKKTFSPWSLHFSYDYSH